MFLDPNQTSSCKVKSLVQSFENHGLRNIVHPQMGFRDENAFDKKKLPHVKKKIPPKLAPKPKFGDFASVSDSDSFDNRNYCHEVNTNGFESTFPNHELEMPNVSPKLSESSKSLSSGIFSCNETASLLDDDMACDSTYIRGYDDIEKTCDEPPETIFDMQRL